MRGVLMLLYTISVAFSDLFFIFVSVTILLIIFFLKKNRYMTLLYNVFEVKFSYLIVWYMVLKETTQKKLYVNELHPKKIYLMQFNTC